jgi:hypothetical protein
VKIKDVRVSRGDKEEFMSTSAIKVVEISKKLSALSGHKLDEIKDFVDFIASKEKMREKKVARMEGIWAGKGFENMNPEKELRLARKGETRNGETGSDLILAY